jgi:uncharacterized membrane protein YfcA
VTAGHAVAIVAAGFAAGTINTVVGSGSFITFPTLLALGYRPVVANVSNTIGLVPGTVAGATGYRRELPAEPGLLVLLCAIGGLGGLVGAGLLLLLPAHSFRAAVPYLVLVACGLVAAQPRLAALVRKRGPGGRWAGLAASVFATAVYGGYFGAAQGVILLGLLGVFVARPLQQLNAAKNLIAAVVNGLAALLFAAVAPVAWSAVGLLAAGSIAGGALGAVLGRRLPVSALRITVLAVGLGVAGALFAGAI